MRRYLIPSITTLVYWVLFFLLISYAGAFYYWLALITLAIAILIIAVSGKRFMAVWSTWLNFSLFIFSSTAFLLIINSATVRNAYVFFFGAVTGALIYATNRYFDHDNVFIAAHYLEFVHFIYFVTFWQAMSLVFFSLIAIQIPFWQTVYLVAILTFLLARGIVLTQRLSKSSPVLILTVLTLTTAEFFYFLALLPVTYFVAATLLTLWFFLIVQIVSLGQELTSRRHIFRVYTTVVLLAMLLLLLTAPWA